MTEYTQGICHDGAAILRDGEPMTPEEIIKALRAGERDATGFRAMCEAFERLEQIVGLDTGGGMGPAPALNAVEQMLGEVKELEGKLRAECERWRETAEELSAAEGREQALAARAERLAELVQASINGIEWYRDRCADDFGEADEEHLASCERALEDAPETSLARRDAEKMIQGALAIRHLTRGDDWEDGDLRAVIDDYVVGLRRQASEPSP